MKQCDGWPNPGCTNDATNEILGYEFCDHCARAYMPADSSALRGDIANLYDALGAALALVRQQSYGAAEIILSEAMKGTTMTTAPDPPPDDGPGDDCPPTCPDQCPDHGHGPPR
jgi:hypothetical protein